MLHFASRYHQNRGICWSLRSWLAWRGFWINGLNFWRASVAIEVNIIPIDVGGIRSSSMRFILAAVHGTRCNLRTWFLCFNQFDNLVIQFFGRPNKGHHVLVRDFWTAEKLLNTLCISQWFEARTSTAFVPWLAWVWCCLNASFHSQIDFLDLQQANVHHQLDQPHAPSPVKRISALSWRRMKRRY